MSGLTDFGFAWGPLEVVRLAHIDRCGYVLEVRTEHQVMQVYVSEKGRKIETYPVRSLSAESPHGTGRP